MLTFKDNYLRIMVSCLKGSGIMNFSNEKDGAFLIGLSSTNEEICAASGRISTQKGSALDIYEKSHDRDKNASLIGKVTNSGHTSTLEHCYYNLAFSNVSVIVEQFMIEFRLASFTVQSRRYVDFSDSGYYIPDFKDETIKENYIKTMDYLFGEYQYLVDNGIAKEDARFVLPYCFKSNFFCSLNARELILVIKSMVYGRGSKYPELKKIGLSLYEQCKDVTPGVFTDFEKRNENTVDVTDLSFLNCPVEDTDTDDTILISATPDAEKVIAKSALIESGVYSLAQAEKITDNSENVSKIIDSIMKSSRPRSMENALFTFKLGNVSLACLTHFTRHRMHSIQIPNLDTCNRNKYIIPPALKENPVLLERYKACFEKTAQLYKEICACEPQNNYQIYALLSGNTIDIISTMNARELLLFFKLRTCTRAQWEIQIHANKMLNLLKDNSPVLFSKYGPSCYVNGKCPEGKFSCGKFSEITKKYSSN